jgi:O-antigen polymerase
MLKTKAINRIRNKIQIPLQVLLIVLTSLLNWNIFGSPTLAAFFAFTLLVTCFAATTWLSVLRSQDVISISNPLPILIFILLTVYYLLNTYLKGQAISLKHLLFVVASLFLVSLTVRISSGRFNIRVVFMGLILISVILSAVCVFQEANVLPSANNYFKVTGTWVNPNVTAIFLASTFPIAVHAVLTRRGVQQYLLYGFILLIFAALYFLKCRTALIGLLTSGMIQMYWRQSKWFQNFLATRRKGVLYLWSLLLLPCLAISGYYLYTAKQKSADARMHVWNISATIIRDNFASGIGLGRFEHDYNLRQADYARINNPVETELHNGGYVRSAYNEILQNAVEGGLLGILLVVVFFISILLHSPPVRNVLQGTDVLRSDIEIYRTAAYAGAAGFIGMSLFNFTFEAIPAFSVFIIYVSILSSSTVKYPSLSEGMNFFHTLKTKLTQKRKLSKDKKILYILPSLVVTIYVLLFNLNFANALYKNRQAELVISQKQYSEALFILNGLKEKLHNNETYLTNYAMVSYGMNNIPLAVEKLTAATQFSSEPALYLSLGKCYTQLKLYNQATEAYLIANYMEPGLLLPNYELARISLLKADSTSALKYAKTVLAITPKVISNESAFYQSQARNLVKTLNASLRLKL